MGLFEGQLVGEKAFTSGDGSGLALFVSSHAAMSVVHETNNLPHIEYFWPHVPTAQP